MAEHLTISYTLHPPSGTQLLPRHTPDSCHTFPIAPVTSASREARVYYATLHAAVVAARDKLGNELTVWRDAVGKLEAGKESSAKASRDENEEEEEFGGA